MNKIPTGAVTFLFTDIEGSTKLAQEFPETLPIALEKHYLILRKAIESNYGFVFEVVGDAFCSAFENAEDAVRTAIDVQLNLTKEKWGDAIIKVRIGIHSGNAEWNGQRYSGYITLARTARIMSTAYGEQILISNDTYESVKGKFPFAIPDEHIGEKKKTQNEISFRDLGERKLKDVTKPMRLYQVIAEGLREDFPPLKTLDARPNNLPFQLTNFIGRETEIKQIKDFLKQSRLLTLTGTGGAGKTRLALEIGAEVIDDYANGVWFVDLAVLQNKSLLAQTILLDLGAKEVPKQAIEETLHTYLKNKETLIILDNCEHLIDECARITEKLLSNCLKLKIIATSREALKCSGEVSFIVPSMKTPDINMKITLHKLTKYESVRLFIERAIAVNQNFMLNKNNATAISEICYQLDGIPLAIELAAAFIKVLSAESILEKFNDRFTLLSGGRRTALMRHQTLSAMIDWSYDLLSDEEKILLQRLSIFSGAWTIGAAENICSDENINKGEIFGMLNNLIDKSLIGTNEADAKIYYSILKIIREYGLKKFETSEDKLKIQKKYCDYYLKLAQDYESEIRKGNQKHGLDMFEKENENFRQAITLSKKPDPETTMNIAISMSSFWVLRGYFSEGFNTLKNVLQVCKSSDDYLKANLLSNAGYIACEEGEYRYSQIFLRKSLRLFRKIGNISESSGPLITLGLIHFYKSEFDRAKEFYEEALAISRETNFKMNIVNSLVNLGAIHLIKGDYEISNNLFQESLGLSRELKDTYMTARIITNLATIERYKSNFEKANLFYQESLSMVRELGDNQGVAHILANLADTAFKQKDFLKSEILNEECLSISKEYDYKVTMMLSILRLAELAQLNNNFLRAKKFYLDYIRIFKTNEDKEKLANCFRELGKINLSLGDYERAVKFFSASEEFFKYTGKLNNDELADFENVFRKLKTKIGNEKFEFAYEYMKSLTFEQIIEFALEENLSEKNNYNYQ